MTKDSAILLAGLPRSGSTMTCFLLNKVPNAVALVEPLTFSRAWGHTQSAVVRQMVIARIDRFARSQRRGILATGIATSKAVNGAVPTDILGGASPGGTRFTAIDGMQFVVRNVDSPEFSLYIKDPAYFTAGLPFLSGAFDCYATVRNPLAVLLSWRDTAWPLSRGRIPAAERVSAPLRQALEAESDAVARQLIILDYFFDSYRRYLQGRVVRYEDVVASGGRALTLLNPRAAVLDEPLTSRNSRNLQIDPQARVVADRLLASPDHACWHFYRPEDVEGLLRDPD